MDNCDIINEDNILKDINMDKNELIECLLIKQGQLNNISWKDPNYINQIFEFNLIDSIKINGNNFLEILAKSLGVNNFNVKNMTAKTEIVGEEPYYLYELTYIDLENDEQYHINNNINDIANLLSINGDKIYSNAILFRNYIPSLTDSMNLCNITKDDLKNLLYKRAYNTIVIGDSFENKFIEDTIIEKMDDYAKKYFEDENYKKIEIPFLMHNINIWYTIGIIENKLCGKLVNERNIDRCILFTMKTDLYRDNLTLNEVNKIINLSIKLNNYKTPSEFFEEKNDHLGKKIINNKYKVLDKIYNDNN